MGRTLTVLRAQAKVVDLPYEEMEPSFRYGMWTVESDSAA